MKIPEEMAEVIEEDYTYNEKLTLIKYIYSLVQAARLQLNEYIKTMTPKAGFKQCKTGPCLLYIVNRTAIVTVYGDDTLEIGDKPALMDTIECTKK